MIRNSVFWFKDFLQGNRVGRHMNEIRTCFGNHSFRSFQKRNHPKLTHLLDEVVTNSAFYKDLKGYSGLEDFPVINKNIIRENFEALNIPLPARQKFKVSTSGSTGTPFKIYQSKRKKIRNTADTLYFSELAGFKPGYRLLYLRFWAEYYKKSKWHYFLQNIDPLEVADLNDAFLEDYLKNIVKDKSPKGWLGFPSGFDRIIQYLEHENSTPLKANIKSIIAMSEPLSPQTKERMQYYFGCCPVSRYSNAENGILAQQVYGNHSFIINWASYSIEIMDLEKDIPIGFGIPGRIVVTDLYNDATPMIRYDTGDIGIMEQDGDSFPYFSSIEGRKSDVLTNTRGEMVSSFVVHGAAHEFPEVRQYQIIQNGKDYIFRINPIQQPFQREQEFVNFFLKYLGTNARFSIEYVNEIPTLKSGKRKIIENKTQSGVSSESFKRTRIGQF